jgi:hypothetical protein
MDTLGNPSDLPLPRLSNDLSPDPQLTGFTQSARRIWAVAVVSRLMILVVGCLAVATIGLDRRAPPQTTGHVVFDITTRWDVNWCESWLSMGRPDGPIRDVGVLSSVARSPVLIDKVHTQYVAGLGVGRHCSRDAVVYLRTRLRVSTDRAGAGTTSRFDCMQSCGVFYIRGLFRNPLFRVFVSLGNGCGVFFVPSRINMARARVGRCGRLDETQWVAAGGTLAHTWLANDLGLRRLATPAAGDGAGCSRSHRGHAAVFRLRVA